MARRKPTPGVPESAAPPVDPPPPVAAQRPRAKATKTALEPKTAKTPSRSRPKPKTTDADALAEPLARLEQTAARFDAGCESLSRSLRELPRPDDFQPLADHLYAFASTAPALLESLHDVPRAAEPIQASVRALEQLAETLHFAHESFNESLLRLPRAEDYEPLAAPLREFARVAPALAESLAEVLRVARPLGVAVQEIESVGRALRATDESLRQAVAAGPGPPSAPAREAAAPSSTAGDAPAATAGLRPDVAQAMACMRAARQAILDALRTLPQDPAYAALAGQLRELATVSPSLMEWLRQTPTLTAPLTSSVASLQAAATALDQGLAALAWPK